MGISNGNNSEDGFDIQIHNPSHAPAFGSFFGTQFFAVVLTDTSATAFDSDSIPTSIFLNDFSYNSWALTVDEGQVYGIITGVTVSQAIPLPAAFPLFATALAGMGLLGWRRKRKASV